MMDEEDEQVRKEKQHANTLADELKAQRIVWETQEKKRKSMLQEAKDALQQSMEDSKRQHEMYLAVGTLLGSETRSNCHLPNFF